MRALRPLSPLLLLLLPAVAPTPPPSVEVEVVRAGESWTAEFRFDRPAGAWVFARSGVTEDGGQPWRPRSWRVETPGVRLERRGRYDLLSAGGRPVPRRVRVRFTPFSGNLAADYPPALVFTDGSVALFSENFHAFPLGSPAEAARLPVDLNGFRVSGRPSRVRLRDTSGPVLHEGRRVAAATIERKGAYVLFGRGEPVVSDAIAAVLDPGLPQWLKASLARSTRDILGRYAASLGPAGTARPTLMVSWAGPTPRKISMGGSVLPGTIVMRFEGEGVLAESEGLRHQARWFVAHEAAHFWLGETVRYEHSRDSWITEGGADLLAVRAVASADPAYQWRRELQSSLDDCVRLTKGRGVASAEQRGEHRAYYACGAVFGLVAEAAAGKPFAAWLRPLIDANRRDGFLGRAEWLAALRDPALAAGIGRLLDRGSPDPAAAIAALFARAGVAHRVEADGRLRLL